MELSADLALDELKQQMDENVFQRTVDPALLSELSPQLCSIVIALGALQFYMIALHSGNRLARIC